MKGEALALGVVGVLAVAGAAARRGSRAKDLDFDDLGRRFRAFVERRWAAEGLFDDDLRRWARRNGLTFLDIGSHRAVFGLPSGTVLKLTLDLDFTLSNINEDRVWYEAPPDIRPHLVPVLGADEGGRWLVMERVPVTGTGTLPKRAHQRLIDCGLMDITGYNLADDGRVVDYGYLWDEDAWERCVEAGRSTP